MNREKLVEQGYQYAKEVYAAHGVDVDAAMERAHAVPVSMHCWQGDDLIGYDGATSLSGGIAATGSFPGRARNTDELRADIVETLGLIPGRTKLNLHSNYADKHGKNIDRDAYTINEFTEWVDFARENKLGMDFNPTFFSHPMMDGNFTLASRDEKVRRFWIEHGKRCREIGLAIGKQLGEACVVNYWMPDGFKDVPAETALYRRLMADSLDEIFAEQYDERYEVDAIESKLFGFGIESYTVASHEFSFGYAVSRGKTYTIDCGHFHPTESIADKISSTLLYAKKLLLHTSRGVRWDSDHVVIYDDELQRIMREIVTGGYLERVFIAQDYFDASINRIACWVIAMRSTRKALLKAMLDPLSPIESAERSNDFTSRLALLEETKTLPYSAVWDYYCLKNGKPVGDEWLKEAKRYEKDVLLSR